MKTFERCIKTCSVCLEDRCGYVKAHDGDCFCHTLLAELVGGRKEGRKDEQETRPAPR